MAVDLEVLRGNVDAGEYFWKIIKYDNSGSYISITCWPGDVNGLEAEPDYLIIDGFASIWNNTVMTQLSNQFRVVDGTVNIYLFRPMTPQQVEEYIIQLLQNV